MGMGPPYRSGNIGDWLESEECTNVAVRYEGNRLACRAGWGIYDGLVRPAKVFSLLKSERPD